MNRSRRTPQKHPEPQEPAAPAFPMRINKYLALQGHATRREADTLVEKKQVLINGTIAQIGDKVAENDVVTLRAKNRPKQYVYIAFNKPAGMNTHREGSNEPSVLDALPSDMQRLNLFPVGRLDKASSGLLLLTNDGRVTDRLLNPKYEHEKSYEVTTKKPLRTSFKEKMEAGVNIEGYVTKPSSVEVLGNDRFRVTLIEGKSHQIRRMVVALFNEVKSLKRTRIMGIKLGPQKTGTYRILEGKELTKFLTDLGLAG